MAPKPAAGTIVSGLVLLLLAGPVVTATWLGMAQLFFFSYEATVAALATGVAVSIAGLGMLVSGIRRAIARREAKRNAGGPAGPLTGRRNLNSTLWPSEQ